MHLDLGHCVVHVVDDVLHRVLELQLVEDRYALILHRDAGSLHKDSRTEAASIARTFFTSTTLTPSASVARVGRCVGSQGRAG